MDWIVPVAAGIGFAVAILVAGAWLMARLPKAFRRTVLGVSAALWFVGQMVFGGGPDSPASIVSGLLAFVMISALIPEFWSPFSRKRKVEGIQ